MMKNYKKVKLKYSKIVEEPPGEKQMTMRLRDQKRILMAKKAIEKYNNDEDYCFLYEHISDIFARLLKSDVEFLNTGQIDKISLAAKWCPSLDSSYDRSTLLMIVRLSFVRVLLESSSLMILMLSTEGLRRLTMFIEFENVCENRSLCHFAKPWNCLRLT